jgi:3D (Asp-Asp-Asp) domain-containing protein
VLVAQNDNHSNRSASEHGTAAPASDDEAELAAIAPDDKVTLFGPNKCEPIADVSKEFASQVALQGTGKLHDGRVVNIAGACNCRHSPCFNVTSTQWGTAGSGKSLQPFRTVAVDPKVVKLGTLLYVPLLEGRRMPGRAPWGGYVHDGCVIADDTGGHIAGNRLDLFVGRKAYFLGLSGSGGSHAWARHVPVFDGTGICERKGRQVGRKAASI